MFVCTVCTYMCECMYVCMYVCMYEHLLHCKYCLSVVDDAGLLVCLRALVPLERQVLGVQVISMRIHRVVRNCFLKILYHIHTYIHKMYIHTNMHVQYILHT